MEGWSLARRQARVQGALQWGEPGCLLSSPPCFELGRDAVCAGSARLPGEMSCQQRSRGGGMGNGKAVSQKRRGYLSAPWSGRLCGAVCPCASAGVQPEPRGGLHRLLRAGFVLKPRVGTSLRAAALGLLCATPSTLVCCISALPKRGCAGSRDHADVGTSLPGFFNFSSPLLALAGSQLRLSLSAAVPALKAWAYSYVSTSCVPVSCGDPFGHWCFTENSESKVKSA